MKMKYNKNNGRIFVHINKFIETKTKKRKERKKEKNTARGNHEEVKKKK